MKELTTYNRVSGYLVKIHRAINEHFFNNELEELTITIQSSARSYGHITTSKVWKTEDGRATYELNISADYLNRPIEEVVSTMIHECCHEYALMKYIKDTSRGCTYHNSKFKALAESHGIHVDYDPRIGWSVTSPTEETIDFCIAYGFTDIKLGRQSDISWTWGIGTTSGNGTELPRVKKPTSNRRWVCPQCGQIIRSSNPNTNVICGDCGVKFINSER